MRSEAMNILMDSLPGKQLPVSDVMEALRKLWDNDGVKSTAGATEFRASQMNVILHCGIDTHPDELRHRFNTVLEMGHRYPCRLIVLCPNLNGTDGDELQSKIFSQCYVGERGRQHICLEAIILSYLPAEREFLEDQVSVWLDNDLPTYHWLHKVPVDRVKAYGKNFLQRCKRIIYDSSIEPEGYAEAVRQVTNSGPVSSRWRDLAQSRSLPFRQSIGQYLSAFEPIHLVEGLQKITIRYQKDLKGEADCLFQWTQGRLLDCTHDQGLDVEFELVEVNEEDETSLAMEWTYSNAHRFQWWVNLQTGLSIIESDYGQGLIAYPLTIKMLSPAESLGEAFFF